MLLILTAASRTRHKGIRLKSRLEKIKFAVQPKKLYLPRQAKRYARKTEREIGLLPHIVPAGCTAIDGGANKGVYSWWLAQICKRVIAFEPNPQMFAYMSRGVPSNVEPHQLALSDAVGVNQFNLPTTDGKRHHTRGSLNDVKAGSDNHTFEVHTTTIDAFKIDEIGFIKLDLEGSELDCLHGASETLKRCQPVVMTEVTGVAGASSADLFRFMIDRGYQVQVIVDICLQYHGNNPDTIPSERNCVFLPTHLHD